MLHIVSHILLHLEPSDDVPYHSTLGTAIRVIKGDTRNVDYGSYEL